MNIWPKLLAGFITLFLGVAAAVVTGGYFLMKDMCGSEVYQTVYSPDQRFKAVVFQYECGATTGFSTQISILEAAAMLENEPGNVLGVDGHPDEIAPKLTWVSSDHLSVELPSGIAVYKQLTEWGWFSDQIDITYP